MFTNTSRPSAVDVLRPFTVGDQFYADTTSTLAKRAIGTTNQVYIVSGGVPVWSSAVSLTTLTVVDSGFSIVGSSDATKTMRFEVDAQAAGADLTIDAGAQTADRTLSVPVLTGNATLATLSETQTLSGAKTFSAITTVSNTTAATTTTDGALRVAGGVSVAKSLICDGFYSISAGASVCGVRAPLASISQFDLYDDGGAGFAWYRPAGTRDVALFSTGLGGNALSFTYATGAAAFAAGVTVNSATLLSTSVALTNGAGAGAGTLTNAPTAGSPTKWIPINDNGTVRYIPTWT